ncbi:hypothetical protein E2C01_047194 [Portunus trituberculatus]|uniref:Uncharacterized protein n=1 Tax=Portunus trituberculatus TaxID=210409 RepID=A0A5B7G7B1_PORTR|nr:hypothetical protein [Portunus trituberculatus]
MQELQHPVIATTSTPLLPKPPTPHVLPTTTCSLYSLIPPPIHARSKARPITDSVLYISSCEPADSPSRVKTRPHGMM